MILNVVGSSLQMLGVTTEKAHSSRLSLVLRTESCYVVVNPSCLAMFGGCRRLAKYIVELNLSIKHSPISCE